MTSTAYPLATVLSAHPADAIAISASSTHPTLSAHVGPFDPTDDTRPVSSGTRPAFTVRPACPLSADSVAPVLMSLRPGWGVMILADGHGTMVVDLVDPTGVVISSIVLSAPLTLTCHDGGWGTLNY